jgi:hypothetical protein
MPREKAETMGTHRAGAGGPSRRGFARTKRRSKIGLILAVWLVLLGWIGISSYNVMRQYSSVYGKDRVTVEANGPPDAARGSGGSMHDPVTARPGVDGGAGLLLTSGLVVFFLATAIRLMMNKRMQNHT